MENNVVTNREYVYRKHLRGSYFDFLKAVLIAFSFILILGIGSVVSMLERVNGDLIILGFIAIGMVIMFLVLLGVLSIEYVVLFKRFKSISVELNEDYLIYRNSKDVIKIPYENIEEVKFPSIKYLGGWVKIIHKDGNIRLTVVLENIGEFIHELKNKLDSIEKSNVYTEKKMFNFFKTASFSDESWERQYNNIKFEIITMYFVIILGFIIDFTFKTNIPTLAGAIIFPTIGYIVSEIISGVKVKKRVVNGEYKLKPANREKENKMIRICILSGAILYIIIAIANGMVS